MSIAPASGYYRQHHYKPFNLDMVALVPFHPWFFQGREKGVVSHENASDR